MMDMTSTHTPTPVGEINADELRIAHKILSASGEVAIIWHLNTYTPFGARRPEQPERILVSAITEWTCREIKLSFAPDAPISIY
jgi:hypothetical protein